MCFENQVINKFLSLQDSASRRGKEFNLTLMSVRNLLLAKKCYYTGVPLTSNNRTIDRIDNNKGYVKGNVCACDGEVNKFKSSLTVKQIKAIYNKVKNLS